MRNPTARLERCTAQLSSGEFCDLPSLVDMPFPICRRHAEKIHRRMAENEAAKANLLRDLVTETLAQNRDPDAEAREKRRSEAYAAQSVVYYVRIGDHVKIGTTTNLHQRLNSLRIDHDALLATEPGSYELERRRHLEFADERVGRREDFNPSRRLLAHIDAVRANNGQPVITNYLRIA